jgi:hypothetical protein
MVSGQYSDVPLKGLTLGNSRFSPDMVQEVFGSGFVVQIAG